MVGPVNLQPVRRDIQDGRVCPNWQPVCRIQDCGHDSCSELQPQAAGRESPREVAKGGTAAQPEPHVDPRFGLETLSGDPEDESEVDPDDDFLLPPPAVSLDSDNWFAECFGAEQRHDTILSAALNALEDSDVEGAAQGDEVEETLEKTKAAHEEAEVPVFTGGGFADPGVTPWASRAMIPRGEPPTGLLATLAADIVVMELLPQLLPQEAVLLWGACRATATRLTTTSMYKCLRGVELQFMAWSFASD